MPAQSGSGRGCLLGFRLLTSYCVLTYWQGQGISPGPFFIRALIPCIRAPPSGWNHLPEALPQNNITLGVRVLTSEFGGDINIQTIAFSLAFIFRAPLVLPAHLDACLPLSILIPSWNYRADSKNCWCYIYLRGSIFHHTSLAQLSLLYFLSDWGTRPKTKESAFSRTFLKKAHSRER